MMFKYFFAIFMMFAVAWQPTCAQQSFPIRYSSRDGAYLYIASQAISSSSPLDNIVSVRISRDNGKGFRELVVLGRAATVSSFRKICGEDAWKEFRRMNNFINDSDAWNYILSNPSMDAYGLLAFNIKFRHAMGNAYLDADAKSMKRGETWRYRADFRDASNNTVSSVERSVSAIIDPLNLPAPHKLSSFTNDSIVSLKWYSRTKSTPQGLILADVYRQTGGSGTYQKQPRVVLGNIVGDSLLFHFQEEVVPASLYRYYLLPRDEMGNAGQPSDTISVLSFDFASLPLLENVKASDSLNHVFLTWKPLAVNDHLTGIEIQRSRDVRGNYVIVDTVSAAGVGYRDTRVLPGVPYYYRFRILGLKGLERTDGYTGYVTAVVGNNQRAPEPPFGLTAAISLNGVVLNWEATNDPDLYAYFVYRGVSGQDFEVISPGLKTTTFTDTARLSGRTQYAYAVKAVSMNSLQSEFSNTVTIRQPVATLPMPPGGTSALFADQRVRIQWSSASQHDHAIAGYNIYRREVRTQRTFDNSTSAAAQAQGLGFQLLNGRLVNQAFFDDFTAQPLINYEYAVASVDVFGMESTFSPFTEIQVTPPPRVIANCVVRKVTGGIEITWDTSMVADANTLSIYRKKVGEDSFRRIANFTRIPTLYVDKAVTTGTLYSYVIQADRGQHTMAKSDEKNIRY